MMRFLFWQRWLFVCAVGIVAFGLLMAFFNPMPLFALFNRQIDPVFWGASQPPESFLAFRNWVYRVWGATIAGWGVMVAFLVHVPFRRRERWAWGALTAGLLTWYVLDTAFSLAAGVLFNALFNTLLALLFAPPLALTYRFFREKR